MLTIVVPAYNEEARIGEMLKAYGSFFKYKEKTEKLKHEILIIINNTTDNTKVVAESYMRNFPNIRYLDIKPGGKGFATMTGFKEAFQKGSEFIGFVDADMSTRPDAFYDLYIHIGNFDGIIGSRWKKGAKTKRTLGKYIRSKGFNFLVRSLFLFPYEDTQCGAKIFKKEVAEKIFDNIKIPEWAFDVNLLYLCKKNGFKILEHPTIWEDKGGSKIKPFKIPIQMAAGVIRLRLLYSPFNFIVRAYDQLLPENYKVNKW